MNSIQRHSTSLLARSAQWGTILLLAAILLSTNTFGVRSAAAQGSADPITGYGQACADIQGSPSCFDFQLTFVVMGGEVQAVGYREQEISQNGVTVQVISNLSWVGSFQGGDGGALSGTWSGESTMQLPEGQSYTQPSEGTWEGNLFADGTGSGTWTGVTLGQTGTWSISYPAEEFQAGLPPAPTSSPVSTEPPATVQPSPEPSSTATQIAPLAATTAPESAQTPQDQEGGIDPALEEEAAAAAGDPLNALAGGTAGTLLGGLLAYLASRGSDLARKGSELSADLQQAWESYQETGQEIALPFELPLEDNPQLQNLIDSMKASTVAYPEGLGKALEPEGYLEGSFRKLSAIKDSAYQKLGQTLNGLSLAENLAKIRGLDTSALKRLGPISFAYNAYDRSTKLLKERGDEPFLYQASTVLEAATVELVKTAATANPFIFIEDQVIGQAAGKPPSEYIADKSHSFIQDTYKKWKDRKAPGNIEVLEWRRETILNQAREFQNEFDAKIQSGEIGKEKGEKELRSILRAYRQDYVELSAKLNQHNAEFQD
ncbi:MAG: hypothetical protein P8Y37_12170 [Anaerolineales bacterium]